jgi:hypothetical protein
VNQSIRVGNRQRAKRERLDKAEDDRVRADA